MGTRTVLGQEPKGLQSEIRMGDERVKRKLLFPGRVANSDPGGHMAVPAFPTLQRTAGEVWRTSKAAE